MSQKVARGCGKLRNDGEEKILMMFYKLKFWIITTILIKSRHVANQSHEMSRKVALCNFAKVAQRRVQLWRPLGGGVRPLESYRT
jgi:hypothetical protein